MSYEMVDVLKRLREINEKNPEVHSDALENVEKMTAPVEEAKKAKPDFLDMDKDGNKKEPMKKAIKDKEKKKVDESITISADSPEDLPVIAQIMKLAGMQPVTPDMMPDVDNVPAMKADDNINGNADCGCDAPEYDNSPDEQYKGVEDVTTDAGVNGLNGKSQPQDIRVKDASPYADYEQRLAQLAGIENEEVEDEVTDQETEEGYANSMGNEKEDPTYKGYDPDYSDHTEDGKPKVRYIPSRYGDNPLESIENNLKSEYEKFKK